MSALPSAEQVAALRAYAKEHGRTWKSRLLFDWTEGRSSGPLQEVRNQLGPSWLMAHGSEAIKPPKKAADQN